MLTIDAVGVPDSLRQLVERQFEQLSPEDQSMLSAASVTGMACSAAAVAAGVQAPVEAVEERCAQLARQGQFLQGRGVEAWPDGSVAGRYAFRHALYPEVIYARLPAAQCRGLHQRIGARVEAGYGARAGERAVELAVHFERGSDAVLLARSADDHKEAETSFQRALDVARRQGAKAWELRSAVSLGRMWQGRGRRADARQLVASIYDWYTEGFDTADLQEARALLAELGHRARRG